MTDDFYIVHSKDDFRLALADNESRHKDQLPGILCVMLNARLRILHEPGFEGLGPQPLSCPYFEYVDLPIQAAMRARVLLEANAKISFNVVSAKPALPRTLRAMTRFAVPHRLITPICGHA